MSDAKAPEAPQAVAQPDMGAVPTPEEAAAVEGAEKHVPVDGGPDVTRFDTADGFTPAGEEGPTLGITKEASDAINAKVDAIVAEEHEKGYRGYNPDRRSNDEYTIAGVIAAMEDGPAPRRADDKLQFEGAAHPGALQDEHPQGAGPTGA